MATSGTVTNPITTVAQAQAAGAYDKTNGTGSYARLAPTPYNSSTVTNPTGPSSSSTVNTNNAINQNTTTGTNAANGAQAPLNNLQSKIISTYGFDEDYVRGLSNDAQAQFALALRSEDVAQKQADQAKADETAKYQASLSQQNAQYAQAKSDLDAQKEKDLATAKTTAASLNPYGGPNTDEDNYTGAINHAYGKLQTQLDNSAAQAKAALDAGDMDAYAQINDNMAKLKEQGIANIQGMLSDLQKTQVQQTEFAQTEQDKKDTLKQNDELKNTTLFQNALQNLPQPKSLIGLPSDFTKLSPDQKKMVQGQEAYEVGLKAGLSPQAAWSGIKNAAGSAYKQQAADARNQEIQLSAIRAQAYLASAQAKLVDKQSAAVDAQTVASAANGAFLSAFQNAQAGGKYSKDKNSSTLSNLAYQLGNGDTTNAKTTIVNYALSGSSATDQRMYQTLQGLPTIVNSIKSQIAALPKDQQQGFFNGSINDIAAKFGQSKDPKLQEIAFEMGHLQKNYVAPIYGMRAAATSGDSIFNNLFPSGTDANTLSIVKLDALTDTAKDSVNSQVQARIGTDPYKAIFGDAGTLNPSAPIKSNSWNGLTVGQDMINQKDGKLYTITANGPVLKTTKTGTGAGGGAQ